MDFDVIIANPPYGKIGADITMYIRQNLDFKDFVNLLPANDYKRASKLWNYISDINSVINGFEDAIVTTHVARIHKNQVNNMSLSDYEISCYIDPQLDKYFKETAKRKHYAIDNYTSLEKVEDKNIRKIIYIGCRDVNHGSFPKSVYAQANFINLNLGDYDKVCELFVMRSAKVKGEIYFLGNCIVFNSEIEKQHMSDFLYSKDGFRFMSKVFRAIHADGRVKLNKFLPKVDWTRSWTLEEILQDYGYSENEIQEIIEDLNTPNKYKDFIFNKDKK